MWLDKYPCAAWNGIHRKENNANVLQGLSVTQIESQTVVIRTAVKKTQTETQTGTRTEDLAADQAGLVNHNNLGGIKTETEETEDRNLSRMHTPLGPVFPCG
jgi:hypothetical protein